MLTEKDKERINNDGVALMLIGFVCWLFVCYYVSDLLDEQFGKNVGGFIEIILFVPAIFVFGFMHSISGIYGNYARKKLCGSSGHDFQIRMKMPDGKVFFLCETCNYHK